MAKKTKRTAPTKKTKTAPKKAAKTTSTRTTTNLSSTNKVRSKSEIVRTLADVTGLAKKDVVQVFDSLGKMIGLDLGTRGPGVFNVPGLMKIVVHKKPATKARKGVNPFTGEEMMFKAKPARNVVKIRALKALKEMV